MEKWMKGRYMANQKRLSVGTGVPAPRGRGIVMLILLALVVALAAVSVTTVAKLSSVNSRNIAMMQEQCRDAVALSTRLAGQPARPRQPQWAKSAPMCTQLTLSTK